MTQFTCTIEFRDYQSGAMHHFVEAIDADDADTASRTTERHFHEQHDGNGGPYEIERIVCMVAH